LLFGDKFPFALADFSPLLLVTTLFSPFFFILWGALCLVLSLQPRFGKQFNAQLGCFGPFSYAVVRLYFDSFFLTQVARITLFEVHVAPSPAVLERFPFLSLPSFPFFFFGTPLPWDGRHMASPPDSHQPSPLQSLPFVPSAFFFSVFQFQFFEIAAPQLETPTPPVRFRFFPIRFFSSKAFC